MVFAGLRSKNGIIKPHIVSFYVNDRKDGYEAIQQDTHRNRITMNTRIPAFNPCLNIPSMSDKVRTTSAIDGSPVSTVISGDETLPREHVRMHQVYCF
jgi:hypothetical protein